MVKTFTYKAVEGFVYLFTPWITIKSQREINVKLIMEKNYWKKEYDKLRESYQKDIDDYNELETKYDELKKRLGVE